MIPTLLSIKSLRSMSFLRSFLSNRNGTGLISFPTIKCAIERLNRTYKASYRPTNGFDNIDGANYDLALWVTYYNFLRPHEHNHYRVLNEVDLAIAALQALKEEREKRQNLELMTAVQRQQIAEMKPKVSYYDQILQNKNTVPVTQIAKDYGMSGRKFNALLHELGIQYKFRKTWLLYQDYAEQGYTQSRTYALDCEKNVMHTYWTQKGRLFLYDRLKKEGILPKIEMED